MKGGVDGNPAGGRAGCGRLDDSSRLAVAAAVGYSETAFIDSEAVDGSYRVRYWSALAEARFCGHATVAAAVVLVERHGPGELLFRTQAGPVAVRTSHVDGLQATGPAPTDWPGRTGGPR